MQKTAMFEDNQDFLTKFSFIQTLFTSAALLVIVYIFFENLMVFLHGKKLKRNKSTLEYGYSGKNGPKWWRTMFPACCKGENQSPINIDTRGSTCVYGSDSLIWGNIKHLQQPMRMCNTGNTVTLVGDGTMPKISGGPLQNKVYKFLEADFRWGPDNNGGSEHSIDCFHYPLEVQLRFQDSSGDEVFIAIFCKMSSRENHYLNCVIDSLNEIILPGYSTKITFFWDWLKPFSHGYYSYSGSFTYPPCCQNVTWIINPQPINISSAQVEKFRELRNSDGRILSNSRPIQPLNSRAVFFHEDMKDYECKKK